MLRELLWCVLVAWTSVQHSRAFSTIFLSNPSLRIARAAFHGKTKLSLGNTPVGYVICVDQSVLLNSMHLLKVRKASIDSSWSTDQVIQWAERNVVLTDQMKTAIKNSGVKGSDLPAVAYTDWTAFGLQGFKAKKLMELVRLRTTKTIWIKVRDKESDMFIVEDQRDLEKILTSSFALGLRSRDTRKLVRKLEEVEEGKEYELVAASISALSKVVEEQQFAGDAIKSRAEYALPALIRQATGLTVTYQGSDISLELRGKTADLDWLFQTQDTTGSTRVILERKRQAQEDVLDQMVRTRILYQDIIGPEIKIISVLFAEACPEEVIVEALDMGFYVLTTRMELRSPGTPI